MTNMLGAVHEKHNIYLHCNILYQHKRIDFTLMYNFPYIGATSNLGILIPIYAETCSGAIGNLAESRSI